MTSPSQQQTLCIEPSTWNFDDETPPHQDDVNQHESSSEHSIEITDVITSKDRELILELIESDDDDFDPRDCAQQQDEEESSVRPSLSFDNDDVRVVDAEKSQSSPSKAAFGQVCEVFSEMLDEMEDALFASRNALDECGKKIMNLKAKMLVIKYLVND